MPGWGIGAWGGVPWGLGAAALVADPALVPDEGGIVLTIYGIFTPNVRAVVEIDGANCPLPKGLGGIAATGDPPGTGHWPVTSSDGMSLRCVCPQLIIGWHGITVTHAGLPPIVQANAIEVVRRDHLSRTHALRAKFPTPPWKPAAIGAKTLRAEKYIDVASNGQREPMASAFLLALGSAIHEASGVLYTRLVAAPFAPGSTATIVSSNAGDIGQISTLVGRDTSGNMRTEALVLNGIVPVTGTQTWDGVDGVSLNRHAAGTITVSDGLATPPERIVMAPGYAQKVAGDLHVGDTLAVVEGNYRFPDAGELALKGERIAHSARVCSSVYNAFTISAATVPHHVGEMVADHSGSASGLDRARAQATIEGAEGSYLNALGRLFGAIERPAGLSDDLYRLLIRGTAGTPRGTRTALWRLLTMIFGSPPPEVIEDPISFVETYDPVTGEVIRTACPPLGYPCTVWIDLGAFSFSGTTRFGRWFLCGGEPQTSTAINQVPITYPANFVYGVYLTTDHRRQVNYLNAQYAADATLPGGATPDRVQSAGGNFLVGDQNKFLLLDGCARRASNGAWQIISVLGVNSVDVAGPTRQHGEVAAGLLSRFSIETDVPWEACLFGPDHATRAGVAGVEIEVLAVDNDPSGVWVGLPIRRTIAGVTTNTGYIDKRTVEVNAPWPGVGSGISWRLRPNFAAEAGVNLELNRSSVAGLVVTLGRNLPAHPSNVTVDYSAVNSESGQLALDTTSQNNPPGTFWPAYLYDGDSWIGDFIDEFVPAGWRVRLGDPHS